MYLTLAPYLTLIGAIWIASLGVPIPEDIALVGGGIACASQSAELFLMIPTAMFAVLSGDLFIYFLGHRWAANLLEHRMTRHLASPDRVAKLKLKFHEHQMKTIFVGRFLPGVRALVFLTAGAMKINVWKFLLVNGCAALISVPAFVLLGYLFGHSYLRVRSRFAEVEHFVVFVLVGIAIVWVLWLAYSRSARAREADALLRDKKDEKGKHVDPSNKQAETSAKGKHENGGFHGQKIGEGTGLDLQHPSGRANDAGLDRIVAGKNRAND